MHRIHAILEDQKKSHAEHHAGLKKVSIIVFILCVVLIAFGLWYTQMYLSELSEVVTNVAGNRFEEPEN